ncbi:MAG: YgiT-type zinc finger protein [Chloroflexota bacterium]
MKTHTCPKCGSVARLRKTTLNFEREGFHVRIEGVAAYRCAACGHETLPGPVAVAVMNLFDQVFKATNALRKAGALPAPDTRLRFPAKRATV